MTKDKERPHTARRLRAALDEIRQISCGEKQVADDDTGGMAVIYGITLNVLAAPLQGPACRVPYHMQLCDGAGCTECERLKNLRAQASGGTE